MDLLDAGDTEGLRTLLETHPHLVHQRVHFEDESYFRSPALLAFVAENPIRNRRLPANIVEVTQVILDAEPDAAARNEALMLVATGCVPRECNVQVPLIDLLCRHGARPNAAIRAAAAHGEHRAARALLALGAKLELPVGAALGLAAEFGALLPSATAEDRHFALAMAAHFGHVAIMRSLLDAGEDPNRFNPPGAHAHSTPLHQAVAGGHAVVVRLLVERGARLDVRDTVWHATPREWARHEGKTEIEKLLTVGG